MFISKPGSQKPHKFKEQIKPICRTKVGMLNIFHYLQTFTKIITRKIVIYTLCVSLSVYLIIPKTKKFGCVGRGDLTLLFKSCEVDKSQKRLVYQRGR